MHNHNTIKTLSQTIQTTKQTANQIKHTQSKQVKYKQNQQTTNNKQ